jgi:hypothetical protein
MNNKKRLRIFYLDYDAINFESRSRDPMKGRPSWFSYELCLINLLYSIVHQQSSLEIHFTWWYDKSDDQEIKLSSKLIELVNQLKDKGHFFEIICADFQSGAKSAKQLFKYLSEIKDEFNSDIIYTCENDYLHVPDWIFKIENLYNSNINFDYVSLYDHKDNYTLKIHQDFITTLYSTENNIWRTGFSTCFSKISTLEVIKRDLQILSNYDDFICFTYLKLFNRKLLISIPGLSTHAMQGYESPAIQWSHIAKNNY